MAIMNISINLDKIDKNRIYQGKKGKYLNLTAFVKEQGDEYGNNGFVAESVSKEEKDNGIKGNILGNIKIMGQGAQRNTAHQPKKKFDPSNVDINTKDDDLPF